MPRVEFAGVPKSTWKRQPFTLFRAPGAASMASRNSSSPVGGALPLRKLAASKLWEAPRPAGGMVKAMAVGFGLPVPASIAARSSAKTRTPLKVL
ncbi:MAG: hypothetical protein DME48_09560 [Verrucomicrobia bacterium]|nr:MAG: hypothetical protein DME48_09560 [Verrucomicrobiota bacterium]